MLNFAGEFTIPRTVQEVYDFLTDPARLVRCLPDVKTYEIQDRDHFDVTLRVGFSRVRGPLGLKIEMTERKPYTYARVLAKGKLLNSNLSVDGSFAVSAAADGSTLVKWTANAKIGVILAQIVGGAVDGLVQEKVAQFVRALETEMSAPGA